MERIKQAVEQAARERKANLVREKPAGRVDSAEGHNRPATAPSLTAEVEYTQTKHVEVSPSVRENQRLVAAIAGHPLRDTYRMLRTRVMQEMVAEDWKTIAVTSPATGSGKSLTAINLAISIAMDVSHTVLLIDADLRHPAVHKYFGYEPELGLSDYLFGDTPLSSILFHPDIDRLSVLPCRESIADSAEVLKSPKMIALLEEVAARYSDRIIVIDLPPVLTVDDAISIAPNVDCMLLVAESGKTSKDDLRKTLELLEGIPLIGTVLNKANKKVGVAY
jgi:capsular exopolysaccharide synthesis family protein